MRIEAKNEAGQWSTLPLPVEMTIESGYDIPADSLQARFDLPGITPAALPIYEEIRVEEGENILFWGIIDEQDCVWDESGWWCDFTARSFAAVLLDNEAKPQTYNQVTLGDLWRHLAEPLGFTELRIGGADAAKTIPIFVSEKGMSVYEVLDTFCTQAGLPQLRVPSPQLIDATRPQKSDPLLFSKAKPAALRYFSVRQQVRKCEIISAIYLRDQSGEYTSLCSNAWAGGHKQIRYLNPSGSWATLGGIDANERMRASMLSSREMQLGLLGIQQTDWMQPVFFESDRQEWFVAHKRYRLDENGSFTQLSLRLAAYL